MDHHQEATNPKEQYEDLQEATQDRAPEKPAYQNPIKDSLENTHLKPPNRTAEERPQYIPRKNYLSDDA